jgi:hypothetical protein
MQLHVTVLIKAVVRDRSARWSGAVELLQPVIIAFNISGVVGSVFALTGVLAVAVRRGLASALHDAA